MQQFAKRETGTGSRRKREIETLEQSNLLYTKKAHFEYPSLSFPALLILSWRQQQKDPHHNTPTHSHTLTHIYTRSDTVTVTLHMQQQIGENKESRRFSFLVIALAINSTV